MEIGGNAFDKCVVSAMTATNRMLYFIILGAYM